MTPDATRSDPYGKALLDMIGAVSGRDVVGAAEEYDGAAEALDGLVDRGDVPAGMLFHTCMYSALCHDIAGNAGRAERMYARMEREYAGELDRIVGSKRHGRRLAGGLAALGRRHLDEFSAALSDAVEWIKSVESRTGEPIKHDRADEYTALMSTLILLDDFFASMADAGAGAAEMIAGYAREAGERYKDVELLDLDPPVDFMACLCLRLVQACSERSVAALGISPEAKAGMLAAGIYELRPPQKRAVDAGMLEGRSIVCASQGDRGGPLLACIAHGLNGGSAVAYLVSTGPHARRAAMQIGRISGGRLRIAVEAGPSYGRGGAAAGRLRDCDLIVATHTRMHDLLRSGVLATRDIGAVVVDDAHDMGDGHAGADLEAVLALLRPAASGAAPQLLVLSAPAADGDVRSLAGWLGAEAAAPDSRTPGAGEWVFLDGLLLGRDGGGPETIPRAFYAPDDEGGGGKRLRACYAMARWSMIDGASLLILAGGAGGPAGVARAVSGMLLRARALDPDIDDAMRRGGPEWNKVAERIEAVDGDVPPHAATLASLARSGVLYYHAELGAGYRDIVEDAARSGLMAAVVAPCIPGADIGVRFDTVAFCDPLAAGEGGGGILDAAGYRRLAGTAGRGARAGRCILVAESDREADEIRSRLWGDDGGAGRLRSTIGDAVRGGNGYGDGNGAGVLPRLLLGIVAREGAAAGAAALADRLRSSWMGPPPPPAQPAETATDGLDALVRREMDGLAGMGLVTRDRDGLYAATPYGARAGASGLSPRQSALARACLEALGTGAVAEADLDAAILVAAGVAMGAHGARRGAKWKARVPPDIERLRGIFEGAGLDDPILLGEALGIAAVLRCWTASVPVAAIMERCGIAEDTAARIEDGIAADAARLLSAIEGLAAAVPCAAGGGIRARIARMAERCLRAADGGAAAPAEPAGIPGIARAAPPLPGTV